MLIQDCAVFQELPCNVDLLRRARVRPQRIQHSFHQRIVEHSRVKIGLPHSFRHGFENVRNLFTGKLQGPVDDARRLSMKNRFLAAALAPFSLLFFRYPPGELHCHTPALDSAGVVRGGQPPQSQPAA